MTPDGSQSTPRPKATLFCPSCGHEGHAIHGWDVRTDSTSGVSHLHCPDCGEHVHDYGLSSVSPPTGGFAAESRVQPAADD
ncbi:hypothetical protein [Salinibaculum salinum]|uniref:hypothetical protein n=1 Tax=Salinibaculum salinum TaxID=3131996 RepID=UPI0030EC41F9